MGEETSSHFSPQDQGNTEKVIVEDLGSNWEDEAGFVQDLGDQEYYREEEVIAQETDSDENASLTGGKTQADTPRGTETLQELDQVQDSPGSTTQERTAPLDGVDWNR